MKHPLVSVIIPVYNMSQYVAETLDSVLAADYPAVEIVVVDDGSTDNSAEIVETYTKKTDRIRLFKQKNSGVSAARNYAIKLSQGEYILPVDADDIILSDYIPMAVRILMDNSNIKVVSCEVERFGKKTGMMHYPEFSCRMLARKNMIDCCSMFRKSDWEKCGGFCEQEIFREDWDFWISILKTGGNFLRLPFVGLRYRVTGNSRRINVRKRKREIVDAINKRHAAFLNRQLGGKLHYHRTFSRFFNFFCRIVKSKKIVVAQPFAEMEEAIYHLPETLTQCKHLSNDNTTTVNIQNQEMTVSIFMNNSILQKIKYGFFKKSQACKLYKDAQKLQKTNVSFANPAGYYEEYRYGMLVKSYYVCRLINAE